MIVERSFSWSLPWSLNVGVNDTVLRSLNNRIGPSFSNLVQQSLLTISFTITEGSSLVIPGILLLSLTHRFQSSLFPIVQRSFWQPLWRSRNDRLNTSLLTIVAHPFIITLFVIVFIPFNNHSTIRFKIIKRLHFRSFSDARYLNDLWKIAFFDTWPISFSGGLTVRFFDHRTSAFNDPVLRSMNHHLIRLPFYDRWTNVSNGRLSGRCAVVFTISFSISIVFNEKTAPLYYSWTVIFQDPLYDR